MDESKPKIDIAYCDENNIKSKWFKFDDEIANLLMLCVEDSVYPDNDPRAGQWFLDGAYIVGLTVIAMIHYKLYGYINSRELDRALMERKDMKTARAAFRKAVENIDQSRIQCAQKIYNGTHAHDKYNR